MHRLAVGFSIVMGPCLLAQTQPAPLAESAPVFTAYEALAVVRCEQLARYCRTGESAQGEPGLSGASMYSVQNAIPGADGSLQFADDVAHPRPTLASEQWLRYLVPDHVTAETTRVFCVRGDGAVAYSDNSARTAMNGDRQPLPDDVLGQGGKGTLLDFPRTPSRGRDGNLWLPIDMIARRTMRVMVVDERGEPFAAVVVAVVPAASPAEAIDGILPCGQVRTQLEGDALLSGVAARGFVIDATLFGVTTRIASEAVRVEGNSLRITLTRAVLQGLRVLRNESAAIATVKNISSAQAQCQACGVIDANKNGAGEFGTFAELTGRDVVRGGAQRIQPPVLSTAFSRVERGVVERSGYCFRLWLPGKDAVPVGELAGGGPDAAAIDARLAEKLWCLYAWPKEPGVTGQRVFFIDHAGDVLSAPNADGQYAGPAQAPKPDAARAAGSNGHLDAGAAVNAPAIDGQTWVVIG